MDVFSLVVSAVAPRSSVAAAILRDTQNLGRNPLRSLQLHLQTKKSRRLFKDDEYFTITSRNPTSSKSLAKIAADTFKNGGPSSSETLDLIYQRFSKNGSATTEPVQFRYSLSKEMACATRLLVASYGKDGMRGIPVESLSESHLVAFIDGLQILINRSASLKYQDEIQDKHDIDPESNPPCTVELVKERVIDAIHAGKQSVLFTNKSSKPRNSKTPIVVHNTEQLFAQLIIVTGDKGAAYGSCFDPLASFWEVSDLLCSVSAEFDSFISNGNSPQKYLVKRFVPQKGDEAHLSSFIFKHDPRSTHSIHLDYHITTFINSNNGSKLERGEVPVESGGGVLNPHVQNVNGRKFVEFSSITRTRKKVSDTIDFRSNPMKLVFPTNKSSRFFDECLLVFNSGTATIENGVIKVNIPIQTRFRHKDAVDPYYVIRPVFTDSKTRILNYMRHHQIEISPSSTISTLLTKIADHLNPPPPPPRPGINSPDVIIAAYLRHHNPRIIYDDMKRNELLQRVIRIPPVIHPNPQPPPALAVNPTVASMKAFLRHRYPQIDYRGMDSPQIQSLLNVNYNLILNPPPLVNSQPSVSSTPLVNSQPSASSTNTQPSASIYHQQPPANIIPHLQEVENYSTIILDPNSMIFNMICVDFAIVIQQRSSAFTSYANKKKHLLISYLEQLSQLNRRLQYAFSNVSDDQIMISTLQQASECLFQECESFQEKSTNDSINLIPTSCCCTPGEHKNLQDYLSCIFSYCLRVYDSDSSNSSSSKKSVDAAGLGRCSCGACSCGSNIANWTPISDGVVQPGSCELCGGSRWYFSYISLISVVVRGQRDFRPVEARLPLFSANLQWRAFTATHMWKAEILLVSRAWQRCLVALSMFVEMLIHLAPAAMPAPSAGL